MKPLCFAAGALVMFLAGRAYPSSYVVSGVLKVHSEDENQIVAEIRIGNATDSKKKLLLVGKPDMAFKAFVHEYANEKVTLRLETSDIARKDGE